MAKKKAPVAGTSATAAWLTSAGYEVRMDNSNTSFIFRLDVQGTDGNAYHLFVNDPNQNPGLVQKVLRIIADRWPAYAFQFTADADRAVTDVQ
jgi:hypothetical protein